MPIYEFYCPDNNRIYSFFARSISMKDLTPRCPDNPELRMEKRVSRFSVTSGGTDEEESQEDEFLAGMDEAKMHAVMQEMEKEMSGIDDENPDPRQLGRFMSRIAGAMGGKVPDAMREMINRLENGEDPDALEAEFGDAFDDEEMMTAFLAARGRQTKAPPSRDPKLYEMKDYV